MLLINVCVFVCSISVCLCFNIIDRSHLQVVPNTNNIAEVLSQIRCYWCHWHYHSEEWQESTILNDDWGTRNFLMGHRESIGNVKNQYLFILSEKKFYWSCHPATEVDFFQSGTTEVKFFFFWKNVGLSRELRSIFFPMEKKSASAN